MSLYFFISLVFSPFAAAMAYIITYEEYKKFSTKKKAMRHSFEMAGFTAVVFIVIGTLGGFLFQFFLSNH
jgi:ABC-type sulfate transport system permease component